MISRTILFILFFSVAVLTHAQNIYICKSYTPSGAPIEAYNEWEIDNNGLNLFILFQNNERINGPLVYLFIDKFENGAYYPYDSKAIKISEAKTWLAYNYRFAEPGTFAIYFQDAKQKQLADIRASFSVASLAEKTRRSGNSIYYESCSLSFCDVVIAGKPMNIRRNTTLAGGVKKMYVYIDNFKPLNTSKILVHVWRKKNYSFSYDEFVDSKKFKLEPQWNDTYFKYVFIEPGDYKIIIYNEAEIFMVEGYFQVYQ